MKRVFLLAVVFWAGCSKAGNAIAFDPIQQSAPIQYISYNLDSMHLSFEGSAVYTTDTTSYSLEGITVTAQNLISKTVLAFAGFPFQKGNYTIASGVEQTNSIPSAGYLYLLVELGDTIQSVGARLSVSVDSIDYYSIAGSFSGYIVDQKGQRRTISSGTFNVEDPGGLFVLY